MTQTENLTEQELKTLPGICILAAMADGSQSALERNEVKRLANRFSNSEMDLNAAYQDAQSGRTSLPKLASQIQSNEGKQLAYEMAVCVCSVDNALNESEKQFLANLHRTLGLDLATTQTFQENAANFSVPPLAPSLAPSLAQPPLLSSVSQSAPANPPPVPSADSEVDQIILSRAILAGALEIMPQNLATMAIIPVQMQLVYQLGKRHGFDLSLSHTKEFLATIGVGMTSQIVESYLTSFVRGAAKKFGGKLIAGLATQATESAIAFATTYAIGHAANKYYASGRTLSVDQLQGLFTQMVSQGKALNSQYASQILQRSSKITSGDLLSLVRQ